MSALSDVSTVVALGAGMSAMWPGSPLDVTPFGRFAPAICAAALGTAFAARILE